jgi:hypothetical protein
LVVSCGGGGGGGSDNDGGGNVSISSQPVIVFAGNDLGMHCLNASYDRDVILPPYNNLWAQVVQRGNPPAVNPAGMRVFYEIVNNTFSYGKGSFGQFWDNMAAIFGVNPPKPHNIGLTNNGLSGEMSRVGDHFEVTGVPVTPIDDNGVKNPYQVAKITVRDANNNILATTQCTVPTSDEFNCKKCHRSALSPSAPVAPYLQLHDQSHATSLSTRQTPFLCASANCHVSPALGQSAQQGVSYLSKAIHGLHGRLSANQPTCYDCHPGQQAKCNRSARHTAADGNCTDTNCHGSLANVAATIAAGRIPWVSEPKCATCHGGNTIPQVDTGATLYRNAVGHGGMRCPACHGSPHAMVPSQLDLDNYQAIQYQGAALTIGTCGVCHGNSRGEGTSEFAEEHGGSSPKKRIACHICHTIVNVVPTRWPHAYKWQSR